MTGFSVAIAAISCRAHDASSRHVASCEAALALSPWQGVLLVVELAKTDAASAVVSALRKT
jgi:hypothetical protein